MSAGLQLLLLPIKIHRKSRNLIDERVILWSAFLCLSVTVKRTELKCSRTVLIRHQRK